MKIELLIQSQTSISMPMVLEGISLYSQRRSAPSDLKFSILKDDNIYEEGNAVTLKVDGTTIFFGFIFTIKYSKDNEISITAYDQLRYLKNKDTYVFADINASTIIRNIADDFLLNLGEIEETSYNIPTRIEENSTLYDMIETALDLELLNKNEMFILYDNSGSITLKNIANMVVPILIDEETSENYSYTTSIDEETYNQIKLYYDNQETGKRDIYIAKDSSNINNWGVLQYFDSLSDGENGSSKADALLDLYNQKTKSLSLENVLGDTRVRAGCMIYVRLTLGDISIDNLMLVNKCTHKFNENEHFMNLDLQGGDVNA